MPLLRLSHFVASPAASCYIIMHFLAGIPPPPLFGDRALILLCRLCHISPATLRSTASSNYVPSQAPKVAASLNYRFHGFWSPLRPFQTKLILKLTIKLKNCEIQTTIKCERKIHYYVSAILIVFSRTRSKIGRSFCIKKSCTILSTKIEANINEFNLKVMDHSYC